MMLNSWIKTLTCQFCVSFSVMHVALSPSPDVAAAAVANLKKPPPASQGPSLSSLPPGEAAAVSDAIAAAVASGQLTLPNLPPGVSLSDIPQSVLLEAASQLPPGQLKQALGKDKHIDIIF